MSTQGMMTQGVNISCTSYTSNIGNSRMLTGSGNFNEYLNTNLKPNVSEEYKVKPKDKTVEKSTDTKASCLMDKTKDVKPLKDSKEIQQVSNTSNTYDPSDKISQLTDKIKSIVKDSLKLDDDELSQLMNQLGFTMLDLLNLDNLKNLCMAASGETDVGVLLTDGDLSNQLSTLLQDMKELNIEEFGITQEELKYLLENTSRESKTNIIDDTSQLASDKQSSTSVPTEVLGKENTVPMQEELASNMQNQTDKNVKVLVEKDASMNNGKQGQSVETQNQDGNSQFGTNLEQHTSKQAEFGLGNENSQQKNTDTSMDSNVDQIINNLTYTTAQNVDGTNQQIVEVTQIRDIVNQIVKEIRIQIKPETTSMDISLNPENLGKVNLSVVAKEGILTASFVVESVAAKEAIESQLQLLKDNLNNQGVKVEAIDVTVSNFSFAQSNEMFQGSKEQKQSQRKIKLDNLEELTDVAIDSEINAQMMLTNGNTVDYTA